jgi:hypothetical protein
MKLKTGLTIIGLTIVGFGFVAVGAGQAEPTLNTWVHQAVSTDATSSRQAIAALRTQGYAGVLAFAQTYKDRLPTDAKLRAVLDSICKQKDCDTSLLYWHTDLEQAKVAAQASGKPILSLRLLGNLDEELSCANSRFFRTVLYPHSEISQLLRDRFILHWQPERPVPKVTIDFGDGRKLERTLTGNSIHYILDPQGRPVEALPGLYGPQAFMQNLQAAEQVVRTTATLQGRARRDYLQKYHRDRLAKLQAKWDSDLKVLGLPVQPLLEPLTVSRTVNAEVAGRAAYAKMVVEMPVLSSTRSLATRPAERSPTERLTEAQWTTLAQRSNMPVRLDASSQQLMARKLPKDTSLATVVTNFEQAIALDTTRNEYLFHAQIHNWFANWSGVNTLQTLNRQAYDTLFLTPASDPWLGLVNTNVYTGIGQAN